MRTHATSVHSRWSAWDVKGVALHVLGDDLSLLARQRDASTNSLMLFAEDHPGLSFRALLDGFNDKWVATTRFFSTDLVIDMLGLLGDSTGEFYGDVGLETMSREPVGFFATSEPSPYWQVIAREYVERFVHQSQIRRAIGAPDLSGETVTAAARVVVHALARWMRHYEPPTGTTMTMSFGAAGAWTWLREPDHWSVVDDASRTPTTRIAVSPAQTVAVLSRGVSVDEARAAITIDGDGVIARGALDVMAPMLGRPQA